MTGESSLRTKFKPFSSQQALCDSSYSAFSRYLLLISHLSIRAGGSWEHTGHLSGLNTKMKRRLAGEDNVTPMCNSAIKTRLFFACSFPFSPCALVWSLVAICVMASWAPRFYKFFHYPPQKQIPSNHQLINCISDMLHEH